jgi:transcriptional regulator with XRE-family HTH domain
MDVFSKRLKYIREKKKEKDSRFTQGYVANLIGVARPTFTAYENGTKQPPMETINKIADIFDVSVDYLLGRTDEPTLVKDEKAPYNTGTENNSYDEQPEIHLTPDELKILREIKKHPVLFHDLANAPEKKIKQLIKMWNFIKQDLEEDDEEKEGFGEIED